MHTRHSAFAVILACTVLAGPGGLAGQDPAARPAADSIAERLDRRVPELMELAEIPGLSIALVRDGDVVWSAVYGVRNAETGAPVTEGTVFQAASLSKPVFAYVVMRLVERGVLDLDRPLHELLPNERMAHDPRYEAITARMVLSHSTGLPNWGGDTLDLAFDPGTAFRYSGEGYVWLQGVVEELTGMGLAELARREVLDPLGMDRSGYVWLEAFEDDAAAGHDAVGRALPVRRYDAPNAAYSLLTTAGDYGRFVAAVMDGRGLAPETWREMLAPVLAAEKSSVADSVNARIAWALGWGIQRGDAPASFWHWGDNGAFKALVAAYPDDALGLVYFANSTHGLAIAGEVARIATGNRHWGPTWAEYERWDDPERVARRGLYRAFSDDGIEAGLAGLAEFRARQPSLFDVDFADDLASLMSAGDQDDAAVAVLEAAVAAFPDSVEVRDDLGRTRLEAGRYEEALAAYRALAEDAAAGGDEDAAGEYRERAEWVEVRVRAMRDPVHVPVERLARLAGDYGPRRVVLEDGVLWYRRDGARYRLEPLGDDLFQPVGLATFRIRFEGDDEGFPERIVGLYFDGSTDETARDSSS